MSRRNKEGLDYFPHDVDMSSDDKVQLLESEHGIFGYGIMVKLLERIYRNGYFMPFDTKIMKIFCRANNLEIEKCQNVLDTCFKENIFEDKLFKKYEILTSRGIQKRYCEAIKRRKSVDIFKEYLLINVNILDGNVNIIDLNVDINPQRKGKERKEKEKNKYREYVFLSTDEFNCLCKEFGKDLIESKIEDLDLYIGSNPQKRNKYTDHNRTIRAWIKRDSEKKNNIKEDYAPYWDTIKK